MIVFSVINTTHNHFYTKLWIMNKLELINDYVVL